MEVKFKGLRIVIEHLIASGLTNTEIIDYLLNNT